MEAPPPADAGPASLCLDPGAPLFPHLPAIFFTLHLLYEELKLDSLMIRGARALVGLLQQLARYGVWECGSVGVWECESVRV